MFVAVINVELMVSYVRSAMYSYMTSSVLKLYIAAAVATGVPGFFSGSVCGFT